MASPSGRAAVDAKSDDDTTLDGSGSRPAASYRVASLTIPPPYAHDTPAPSHQSYGHYTHRNTASHTTAWTSHTKKPRLKHGESQGMGNAPPSPRHRRHRAKFCMDLPLPSPSSCFRPFWSLPGFCSLFLLLHFLARVSLVYISCFSITSGCFVLRFRLLGYFFSDFSGLQFILLHNTLRQQSHA